jgi:hypothetical protein
MLEDVVTRDIRDVPDKEFTEYLDTVFLTSRCGVAKHTVRLDNFLKRHKDSIAYWAPGRWIPGADCVHAGVA